jgi:DNA-directed RNA polymerase specialized sigma24 family protein
MEQSSLKRQESTDPVQPEQLLASRYPQLLKWALVLARGDSGKAEEIVQEFCLYVTLTKPDLSNVTNLDGYLYTCLRHIYLSTLARASREALHFVSVEEFDSFAFAVSASPSGDPLQRQNDLRRICNYAVWRKQSSKSASYFILHFFHGYARREIAEIARLPISAIYNKLKTARSEVRSHLEQPGKLRIVNRDAPPPPALSWSLLSTMQLFSELRQTILRARQSDCLSEQDLLAQYRSSAVAPISCSLLAHIVSCERCLTLIDGYFRRPTLKDREPLDVFGSGADEPSGAKQTTDRQTQETEAMLRLVHRRWGRVHEHRPRALSIAVNGQIVAFHDVRAEHNKLSARLENPDKALFAEVFSEQGVRLALLPVGAPPPEGPEVSEQQVNLSDERWLQLRLTFDGLGLHSEVAYFDPALGLAEIAEEDEDPAFAAELPQPSPSRFAAIRNAFRRPFGGVVPASAWALTLLIVAALSYVGYSHTHPAMNAAEVLHESITAETAALGGQTIHQVLHMEAASADGRILQRGTVDVWKDGDGRRYMRRLYDMQHRVVAMEWKEKSGEHGSRQERGGKGSSSANRALELSGVWDQDLSAQAFAALAENPPQVRALGDGYELTRMGPTPGHPQWIAATLVLDHNLLPIRQTIRVHAGSQVRELRFVQANYERKPSTSVPDTVFDPDPEHSAKDHFSSAGRPRDLVQEVGSDVQLAQLQIAVLYQLFLLGADTAAPIEIVRTPQGHIRVSGAVADDTLKHAIVTHLEALPDHQRIELKLVSSRDASARVGPSHLESAKVYELNQNKSAADETLRKYFAAKGLSANALDSAVAQFSRDALQHAQRALQHAYDLDRLANTLSVADRQAISNATQQQWTQMVEQHATELATELRALRTQLNAILPASDEAPAGGVLAIENPEQFSAASSRLLNQARTLHQQVGDYFASNAFAAGQANAAPSTSLDTVPLQQAEEIASFATRLNRAAASAMLKQHDNEGDQGNAGPSR